MSIVQSAISSIRKKADEILNDNQGWFRGGQFTPVQQIQSIQQQAKQSPITSIGGINLPNWQNPTGQDIYKSAGKGFVNTATFGIVQPKYQPQTDYGKYAEKVGNVAGFVAPFAPGSLAMRGIENVGTKVIAKFAPQLTKSIGGKIVSGLGKELAQTAAYTGAQYVAGKAGLRPDEPITAKDFGTNLLLGSAFRGILSPQGTSAISKGVSNMFKDQPYVSDFKVVNEALQRLKTMSSKQDFTGEEMNKLVSDAKMYSQSLNIDTPKNFNKLTLQKQYDLIANKLENMIRSGDQPIMGITDQSKIVDNKYFFNKPNNINSVDSFINAHTVYHGGDANFIDKQLSKGKFNPGAKRDAGTGGNRYGLSTSTDYAMAKDFSTSSTGNPKVAKLFIDPKAKTLNLTQKALDDLSKSEIKQLSKTYDVIRDVDNTGGENEIRILNPNVLRDEDYIRSYWNLIDTGIIKDFYTRQQDFQLPEGTMGFAGNTNIPLSYSKGVGTKVAQAEIQVQSPKVSPIVQESVQQPTISKIQLKKPTTTPEQLTYLKQSKVKESKPLTDIIRSEPIDVKSKVGILDYIRTPDRVLAKIGLKKQADQLRTGYEAYLKELPVEINKITEWSKKVSPESNQRIFQYLDGQPIKLESNELKVANEIKSYLSGWADRLGLPEDKRITNYITHIFDKDFIQKEFDPDIAKLIQNRVAGSVYDPFVEQRLGKMGYVEDTWKALDAYVKRASRKVNMDPALNSIKEASKNLETSQFNYVKEYIDRVNMRPTNLENLVDNSIKQAVGYKFGQRPTALISRAGRQAVYRGALGLNVGSALRNLTQGANTYARLGEKYTLKGYWDILTRGSEGIKELERVGVLADDLIQDRTLSAGKQVLQKLDKGLFFFFETAEKLNRGSAYFGAKAKALSQGLSEEQAIDFAKKTVRDTQFTFGRIDTPVALQNDVVKLLTQFQSFSIKQGEFLGEMASKKDIAGLIRYGLANMALIYTVGQLIGMEPKDMIPSFRISAPPTLSTPIEVGKSLLGVPDKYGNVPDTGERIKNIGNSLLPYIPAGVQAKKTIQGLGDVSRGYAKTDKDLVKYPVEQSPANYVRGGAFGAYNLPEAKEYRELNTTPLSEKQSARFMKDPSYYDKVIENRLKNREKKNPIQPGLLNQIKDKLIGKVSATDDTAPDEILYTNENGNEASLSLTKLDNISQLPSSNKYQQAIKESKQYSTAATILDNTALTQEQQDKALERLGIDPDKASYYQVANDNDNLKTMFVLDAVNRVKSSGGGFSDVLSLLANQRTEVNGKMIASNGVIDNLVDEGVLTKSQATELKKYKMDNGKLVAKTKSVPKVKKVTFKKMTPIKLSKSKPYKFKKLKLSYKKLKPIKLKLAKRN